ncbi:MAG: sensor histidine kinase [Bacteriovoracaceae bacterium]
MKVSLELILLISFLYFMLALVAYLFLKKQKEKASAENSHLRDLIEEKNQKLIDQSKYAELGMMMAGIAHEINNPLAIIQARITQLLRSYRDPEKVHELGQGLEQVLFASERINKTVQTMREFIHQDEFISQGQITLKDLIDDVLSFCGQRLKNHGIQIRKYGVENLILYGNKIQLEQVLLNLINNSFEAVEFLAEKWIEISAHETENKIKIYFKDSGSGVPPEVAKHLMEPFFTSKVNKKGIGLGLSAAKEIIEKHRGKISYLSDAKHTTFLIELPKGPQVDWGLPLLH